MGNYDILWKYLRAHMMNWGKRREKIKLQNCIQIDIPACALAFFENWVKIFICINDKFITSTYSWCLRCDAARGVAAACWWLSYAAAMGKLIYAPAHQPVLIEKSSCGCYCYCYFTIYHMYVFFFGFVLFLLLVVIYQRCSARKVVTAFASNLPSPLHVFFTMLDLYGSAAGCVGM